MALRSRRPLIGYPLDHPALGLPGKNLRDLESLVRLADWRVVIQNVSWLSTVESHHRMFGGEPLDDTIIRQFIEPALRDKALEQVRHGGVLAGKFSLALAATNALRLGEEKSGEGMIPLRETLGEILLAANDIAEASEGLATIVLHTSVSSGEDPFCRLARYYLLLFEIPDSMRGVPGWKDMGEMFRCNTHFEMDRLLSLGFGLYSHYGALARQLSQRSRSLQGLHRPQYGEWLLDSKAFLKNSCVPQQEAHRLMLALSTNPDRFRANPTPANHPFDLTHLKTWPMVHIGETRFCVSVLDFLLDRLTIRAYFDMIDPLPDQEKDAFGGFFGRVVERYVHMLLAEMLGEPAGLVGRWFKPESYGRSKVGPEGPDAIIVDHERGSLVSIFVEVKSSRPNKEAATSGDMGKLREQWDLLLIGTEDNPKAARQLDRAISDFRTGVLRVLGLDPSQVTRIYPVIVTLDPWPFFLDVYSEFASNIAASNILTGHGIAPLDVWSCFDLELLSPQILAGRSLMDTIKQRPDGANHIPLWFQIVDGPGVPNARSPLLKAAWERMAERMVKDLRLLGPTSG